jgi:hypothetical protein
MRPTGFSVRSIWQNTTGALRPPFSSTLGEDVPLFVSYLRELFGHGGGTPVEWTDRYELSDISPAEEKTNRQRGETLEFVRGMRTASPI